VRRGPGDEVGLTRSLGWVDAWTLRPSVYAVAAQTTDDVVAAVNFAREHNLRVVVKGWRPQLRAFGVERPPECRSTPFTLATMIACERGLRRPWSGTPL
jgi:hypothetical protein